MLGSLSTSVNGKIKRISGIRLLGMSIIFFGLCVCHVNKSSCVYPLLLFASAKPVGFMCLLLRAVLGVCFSCCIRVWPEGVKDPGISMSLLCC